MLGHLCEKTNKKYKEMLNLILRIFGTFSKVSFDRCELTKFNVGHMYYQTSFLKDYV